MNARILGLLVMGGVFLACVRPANAELITIQIEAEVTYVEDNGPGDGWLEGKIIPNESIITGYYIYESTTPDSSPLDQIQGNYWHFSPPAGVFLTVGGFDFITDPCDVEFNMFIRNNNPSGDDIYGFDSLNNMPLPNGSIVDAIYWQLNDHTASALLNDALPLMAPSLTQWQDNVLVIAGDRTYDYGIHARVTSAIPEPATLFLLAAGAILLKSKR